MQYKRAWPASEVRLFSISGHTPSLSKITQLMHEQINSSHRGRDIILVIRKFIGKERK